MSRSNRPFLWVHRSVRALRRNDAVRTFTVAFAVIAAVVAVSCDRVPLTSPTGSTIQLSTSTSIVPIDGSAEITATVIESAGTAVQNGTTVVFRADLGRMDPPESQTINGRAVSRFFASGLSGVAKINAYSGAAATGGTVPTNSSAPAPSPALTLLVGGAAASRITVPAEPPTLPQSGGTTQIFASVADTNGAPVFGAPVTFSLSSPSNTTPGILSAPTTQTNAAGVAQTSLTTNQTTTVTATVATASATTPVTANVVVTALAAPSVAVAGCTAAQSVGVAVNCTITPTASGGVAIQNLTVNWGDNTGEQPAGGVSGLTSVSHTYRTAGTFTMVASATDLNSQRGTASINFVVTRVNPTVSITASASTGSVGVPISFTVTPALAPPQPITDVTVDFGDGGTRSLGVISSAATVVRAYAAEGTYTVTATVTDQSGGRGSSTTQVAIGRAAAPTVGLTQTGGTNSANKTFSVTATAATGLSIRSVVVTRFNGGTEVYRASAGGTFVSTILVPSGGDVLTATVTDSAGTTVTVQLVVL